jgi:amino acid adenylation domain-containing protein
MLSSQEKRELLRRLLDQDGLRLRSYPLSYGQERIWLDQQLHADSCLHHVIGAARVEGRLDVAILERSLNELVKRHESLRTTFVRGGDRPQQVVAPTLVVVPTMIDLRETPEPSRPAEAERRAREEARRPFDLARGPLIRMLLIRLADADHLVVLSLHHIIADAWSLGIVTGELWQLYNASSGSSPPSLGDLPIQYGDFAAWQRAHFQGNTGARDLAYWRDKLRGPLPMLELPIDHPRGPAATAPSGSRTFDVPSDLQASVHTLARDEGVTLFMVLLAALQGLLFLYTEQEDMLIGCPVSGRDRPETAPLVGFFVSILLLRTNLGGNPTFRALLRRVQQECLDAYAHSELPTEKLLESLEWRRDGQAGGGLPVRVLFNLLDDPQLPGPSRPLERTITLVELWPDETDLDLNFHFRTRARGLRGTILYRRDLFEPATVDRLVTDFLTLLRAVVTDPGRPLASLGPSDDERYQLRLKRYRAHRAASLDRLDDLERLSNLTKRQLLIWVGHKLRPTAPIYNLAATLAIEGPVDPARFAQAFQTLLNSSDALRTVVEEAEGIPQQRALPPYRYPVRFLDVSRCADPDAELRAWVTDRIGRPFDLAGPLFDAALFKLGPARFACPFVQDHIVTDGWSIWLTFQQLATLYERALADDLPETVSLPQYGAWREHERAYRASSRYLRDRDYWAAKLADPPDALTFYGRSGRKHTTRVDRISCELGIERSRRLLALAAEQGSQPGGRHTVLFGVFAAAFCAFLHHVGGARRLAFVTDIHNRRSRAFKETLGLFVEMVPVRIDVDEEMTLAALVEQVRREMFDVLRHAQYAISNSVHRAVYEAELNYHTISNVSHRTFDGAPVRTTVIHTGHQEESFGIRVLDFENTGNFTLDFDLHCDLFPEDSRPLVIQHFLRILDAFLDDPARPLGRISLLGPEERHRLLTEFNKTETNFPLELTFADLWEAQVLRTPDRPAAVSEAMALTYRELDGRANALAHRLRALRIGPDALVGVCLERSLDALVSLLAVTKAGGAWVPMDPTYPSDRLARILADSRASALVSRRILLELLPRPGMPVIDLDTDGGSDSAAPARATGPRHLAYVIYTSGSTGAPKGAMVEQRGMLNHLLAKVRDLGLTDADAVAETASLAFDISVWQCFAALLAGGRVHVLPEGVAQDPGRLLAAVEAGRISVLEVVPSLLRAMNEVLADAGARRPALGALRWLIATGEELAPGLCHQWLAMYPSIPLLNAYGPTECSDDVTHHVITSPPRPGQSRVPIGRPIANTRLYVLDRWLQPVPLGASGELCVGGVGVGRGYLHDPRRTAQAFVPDPYGPTPDCRLYRTGDRARFLPDGTLEFLGRLDHQVKIRGYRVEPGEIEAQLARYPAIRDCIVMARPDRRDQLHLVAYVVPVPGQHVAPAELRDFLRATLPDAMIPTAFVALDAFPLTPNGKVDRRALPEPEREREGAGTRFLPPRSETERRLTEIWEDVLGVRPIGITESFFDLGGHSLIAVRLMARITAAFGREIPLASLLGEPTIEAFARRLERPASDAPWSPLVPIQPRGSRLPLFCVHPSGGSVMDYHHLARHLGNDQPVFGLEARGLEGGVEPLTDVEEMATHYLAAVRRVRPEGPYALAGHSFGGIVAFEMARQLLEDGQAVALLAMADAWRAPSAGEPTDEDRAVILSGFAHDLGVSLDHVNVAWDHFWRLSPDEQVTYVLDVVLAGRVLPDGVSLTQIRRALRLHATNIDAMRRYVARPIACPVVLLRASEELSVTPREPAMGWEGLTTRGMDVLTVPGNHFTMLREPHVQIIAEHLRRRLDAELR